MNGGTESHLGWEDVGRGHPRQRKQPCKDPGAETSLGQSHENEKTRHGWSGAGQRGPGGEVRGGQEPGRVRPRRWRHLDFILSVMGRQRGVWGRRVT